MERVFLAAVLLLAGTVVAFHRFLPLLKRLGGEDSAAVVVIAQRVVAAIQVVCGLWVLLAGRYVILVSSISLGVLALYVYLIEMSSAAVIESQSGRNGKDSNEA